jgi:hypothetical protein
MNQSLCKVRRTSDRKGAESNQGQKHDVQGAEREEAADDRGNRKDGKTNTNRYKRTRKDTKESEPTRQFRRSPAAEYHDLALLRATEPG